MRNGLFFETLVVFAERIEKPRPPTVEVYMVSWMLLTRWQTLLQLVRSVSLGIVEDESVEVSVCSDLELNLVLAGLGGFLDTGDCAEICLADVQIAQCCAQRERISHLRHLKRELLARFTNRGKYSN